MKKYLWFLHILLGCIGLFSSILRGNDFTVFSYLSVIVSAVALLCLTAVYIFENKKVK